MAKTLTQLATHPAKLLTNALSRGHISSAYLFAGPEGSGKQDTATALCMAANCSENALGCGECDTCLRIAQGVHPDILVLERSGASATIPIAAVREQLLPRLATAPHEAKHRFVVITEAAALLGPAANALLKTLEEPPARTHFLLLTKTAETLLPTIRSRCLRVNFTAGDTEQQADPESIDLMKRMKSAAKAGPGSIAKLVSEKRDKALWASALRLWIDVDRKNLHEHLDESAEVDRNTRTLTQLADTVARLENSNAHPGLTVEAFLSGLMA